MFFFFWSSFDTSWPKYRSEEVESPRSGEEPCNGTRRMRRGGDNRKLQIFKTAITTVFIPVSKQEGVCL